MPFLYSTFRKNFSSNSEDVVKDCMIVFNGPSAKKQFISENVNFEISTLFWIIFLCSACRDFANIDVVCKPNDVRRYDCLMLCFYSRDAMLARVFATATCLSVCPSFRLSVTRRYRAYQSESRIVKCTPSDSPITLVSGKV